METFYRELKLIKKKTGIMELKNISPEIRNSMDVSKSILDAEEKSL